MKYILTIDNVQNYIAIKAIICDDISDRPKRIHESIIMGCKFYLEHNNQFGFITSDEKSFYMLKSESFKILEFNSKEDLSTSYFNRLIDEGYSGDQQGFIRDFFETTSLNLEVIQELSWLMS